MENSGSLRKSQDVLKAVSVKHSIDPTNNSAQAKAFALNLNSNPSSSIEIGTSSFDNGESHLEDENLPSGKLPQATILSSIANLSNTILGSGMLAMPAAFASVGLLFGVFLVLFSACASALGLYFLSQCAQRVNNRNSSFFAVSQLTYPSASKFFDIAIAIKCFGVSISYLIIIGDLMPQIMEYFGFLEGSLFTNRRFWITIFMGGVVPLAFLRRLDSLKYTSIVALCSVAYLVLLVASTFLFGDYSIDWENLRYVRLNYDFMAVLPVFVFGFTCHQNIFSIFNELEDNSSEMVNKVISGSIGSGFLVYQLVGSLGYLTFGNDVKPNVLSMYKLDAVLTFGRFAVVVLALFSYPLQCHPCRTCLLKVIGITSNVPTSVQNNEYSVVDDAENGFEEEVIPEIPVKSDEPDSWYFNIITIALVLGTYGIAMLVTKLDIILGFVGSTGSTSISFILPGAFYLRLTKDQPPNVFESYSTSFFHSLTFRRTLAYMLVVYGMIVMVVCFTFKLSRLFV